MARTIPTAILTALAQKVVAPIFAVEIFFDSGVLRLWNGHGTKTLNGNTYTGAGNLLAIGDLEEVSDLGARGTSVTLSGIPSTYISVALNEPYQRRICNIYFGVETESTTILAFSGYVDTMTIEDTPTQATITITVESKLVELERVKERRYTHESQKSRFPTDTFFSYVADLQDKEIVWGRKSRK